MYTLSRVAELHFDSVTIGAADHACRHPFPIPKRATLLWNGRSIKTCWYGWNRIAWIDRGVGWKGWRYRRRWWSEQLLSCRPAHHCHQRALKTLGLQFLPQLPAIRLTCRPSLGQIGGVQIQFALETRIWCPFGKARRLEIAADSRAGDL